MQSRTWTNYKTSGAEVETIHSTTFGKQTKEKKRNKNISAQMTHTHYQAQWWSRDDFGLFQNHRTWAPCSHWVDHKLLCVSRFKHGALCLTAKSSLKMSHATRRWPQKTAATHRKLQMWFYMLLNHVACSVFYSSLTTFFFTWMYALKSVQWIRFW